ncbi:MAG TPA: hypothetical protein VM308_02335 [Sphingomicrobium sp.]|nr:hypothetical protein [Sphingomicrobium sp.]
MTKRSGLACTAFAAFLASSISSVVHAQSEKRVYAICTVRDVTVFKDGAVAGKVYRSAIFSAPADYDEDISMKPNRGGLASKHFEAWVATKYGLRHDRVSLGDVDEHYCIEAPYTPEGESQLIETVQGWSVGNPLGIEQLFTEWTPWLGKREGRLVPPSEDDIARYKAALDAREQRIAADQRRLREAAARAANALAAHEAELAKAKSAQAEYERQLQRYREEYYRATGRYPDQ